MDNNKQRSKNTKINEDDGISFEELNQIYYADKPQNGQNCDCDSIAYNQTSCDCIAPSCDCTSSDCDCSKKPHPVVPIVPIKPAMPIGMKGDPILGPHEHDGLPLHCHDPRPHHCDLPYSHSKPGIRDEEFYKDLVGVCKCGDNRKIKLKPAYGHVHDEYGRVVLIDRRKELIEGLRKAHNEPEYVRPPHAQDIANKHENANGRQCFPEYIRPWTAYESEGFRHIPGECKPIDASSATTSKTSEIRDSLGNLRFTVSLASYVPRTGNAFDIKFSQKVFLIDVLSYCYGESAINVVHEGFYSLEDANEFFDKCLHRYELIAKMEVNKDQDIHAFADQINYRTVAKCCATCKWACKLGSEDNLYSQDKEKHFVDCHHMNAGDDGIHHGREDWPRHDVKVYEDRYICKNREIFSSNGLDQENSFSVQPEVLGSGVCDKYEERSSEPQLESNIQHEYDEYGHSIYKFFDRNGKGKIL